MENSTEKFLKASNGITLIALVITIIVLLILARNINFDVKSAIIGILQRAIDSKERTTIAQEEENAKLTFTEVQMELSQGKTVDTIAFQKMIDGNFGSGNANGIITGTSYIIKVKNARTYAMSSNGNIANLDKYPIDDNPGILEQSGDIYTINCIEDLVAFSYNVNSGAQSYAGKTVTLGRDLDFKDDLSYADATSKYKKDENGYTPDSTSETTIKSFMTNTESTGFITILGFDGNFDGKEKSLSNLYINSSSLGGLFGGINTEIEILNLSLLSCNIKGTAGSGGIVAHTNQNITINNVHVSGKVESTSGVAGGIVGISNAGLTITNCSNNSDVKSPTVAGGVCYGSNNSSASVIIINSYNTGKIESTNNKVGGIVGNCGDFVYNCYNTGNVISSSLAGGIGDSSSIINSYNTGNVESTGNMAAGIGLTASIIINCYNNGEITGKNETTGINIGQSITNCYNFKSVSSLSSVAGGIAINGTIDNCYNSGTITTGVSYPAGGIASYSATITNSHNSGNIIGVDSSKLGEIIGEGNADNTNNYLIKDNNASNISNAVGKTQSQMNEIMSVQSFVDLMNSYVTTNNADSSKTKLKTWTLANGFPVFSDN